MDMEGLRPIERGVLLVRQMKRQMKSCRWIGGDLSRFSVSFMTNCGGVYVLPEMRTGHTQQQGRA